MRVLLIMSVLLLSSCMKEELPVPASVPGDAQQAEVCMSPTYRMQVYYDLGTASVIASNEKEAWDIAVSNTANENHVFLNSARFMRAALTSEYSLEQVTDTMDVANGFKVDVSSGNTDSLAIDLMDVIGKVIVLDMGYNHIGLHQGMYKMKVEELTGNACTIRYAPLSAGSGAEQTLVIDRNNNALHSHASLLNDGQVYIEPDAGSYDLIFTQYTFYFDDPGTQYLVTGVLSARNGVRVAQFDGAAFNTVELVDSLVQPFASGQDVIGYDWKEYDFDLSLFITDDTKVFLIQDSDGAFHKLRFFDFYSESGQKGCPRFELLSY